jgi:hypothetical protein
MFGRAGWKLTGGHRDVESGFMDSRRRPIVSTFGLSVEGDVCLPDVPVRVTTQP